MRTLAAILMSLACAASARAQPDSTARAIEGTWMQPRTDGRLWHDLPPPANVVTAGYALHHAATTARDARWLRIAGALAGGVLYLADEEHRATAPLTIAGACFAYSVALDFRGGKSLRYAGNHLRSGYTVNTYWDTVPDTMDDGPHQRLMLKPSARMSRKDRRELERARHKKR